MNDLHNIVQGRAVRWQPVAAMPEIPLSVFDLTFDSGGKLVVSGTYRDISNHFPQFAPAHRGVIVEFQHVHSFKCFEEFGDDFLASDQPVPRLAEEVPYGGIWPFVEIQSSSWVEQVCATDGVLSPSDFRHWGVFAVNQTLHVMAPISRDPRFVRWFDSD